MIISFQCHSCREEIKIASQHAGKTGKCKRCNTIITVPQETEEKISFDASDISHSDPDVQRIYSQIIASAGPSIVRHALSDGVILLEYKSGDWDHRTQRTYLTSINTDEAGKCLIIISTIGIIDSAEQLYVAVRATSSLPFIAIALDDDNEMKVRALLSMQATTDSTIMDLVTLVAKCADKIEEELFGWDLQ